VNDNGGTALATDFTLTATGPTPLSGAGGATSGASFDQGTYSLSETNLAGYSASDWSCVTNGGAPVSGGSITLGLGDSATCTITNDDIAPSLTLNKIVINDNGGSAAESAWTLTANGGGAGSLSGSGAPGNADVVSGITFKAGTYILSESTGPFGYSASAWSCVGGTQNGNQITLGLAQSATCTITNNDIAPTLTVVKVLQPSTDSGKFNLQIDGVTKASNVGNNGTTGAVQVNAGTHTVGEIAGTGTNLADYIATINGDCAADGSVTLTIGINKTCVITNKRRGSITVIKDAVPNHAQDFSFTITGGLTPSSFSLDDDANPTLPNNTTFANLAPGQFSVTEGATAGWSLSGLTCNDTGLVGSVNMGSRTATIKLDPGENVTCTFTNSKLPANTGAKTIGFWQNKNGQGIITSYCAGTSGTSLYTFLRRYAPFQDLSKTSCKDIAAYVTNVIKAASSSGSSMNPMLKAQMLATALDVYFSDPALGGNKISAPVPIGGVTIDLTNVCKMIDGSGGTATCTAGSLRSVSSAFGGATSLTVSQMLAFAASQSNVGGTTWYGNVKTTQELAKDAFDAINNQIALTP
jgi:hypothetical protein